MIMKIVKQRLQNYLKNLKKIQPLIKLIKIYVQLFIVQQLELLKVKKNYEFLEKHFKETTIPTEKKTLTLSAMGCVKEKAHVEKYYKFILTENVRKQDKSAALNSLISENPGNAELVFDLIETKHEDLGTALGDGENDVATIVSTICNRFTTKEQKEKVEAFIKKKIKRC